MCSDPRDSVEAGVLHRKERPNAYRCQVLDMGCGGRLSNDVCEGIDCRFLDIPCRLNQYSIIPFYLISLLIIILCICIYLHLFIARRKDRDEVPITSKLCSNNFMNSFKHIAYENWLVCQGTRNQSPDIRGGGISS